MIFDLGMSLMIGVVGIDFVEIVLILFLIEGGVFLVLIYVVDFMGNVGMGILMLFRDFEIFSLLLVVCLLDDVG